MSNLRIIDVRPEAARVAALRSYDVIDTPREQSYDEIVRLACAACEVPAAGISLMDESNCWIKAEVGLGVTVMPRALTICNYAYNSSGTFAVKDARLDPRFSHLPMVRQYGFCFYAGTSIINADNYSLGTLFVLDRQPRELTTAQVSSLRALTKHTTALLEQRRLKKIPPGSQTGIPGRGTGCVLIVDDHPDVLGFAKIAVERLGYEVLTATNGQEALNIFTRNAGKIDIVLTDVNMPVMDGLELVRSLKRLPVSPGIVVMSGRLESSTRAAFYAVEVTHLLNKPFSIDTLELTLLSAKASSR